MAEYQMTSSWTPAFAKRTRLMRRTAVRELLKLTARPEVISFAGGLPAAELFPIADVQQAAARILETHGRACLQYGETEGVAELRDWIARRYSRPHLQLQRQHVLIVSGSQQALDLIGRVLLDDGDAVVVENPTYLALLSAWRPLGARFLAARSDENGVCLDSIKELLAQKPKAVYLLPNFQNPQGTTLARGRRAEIASLLRQHSVGAVEDDPYGELRYSGETLPSLLELNARTTSSGELDSNVIYAGTFSKVLAPGLRVGWIIAPEAVIEKLVQTKQAADLHTSTLAQFLAWSLLREGLLERHLPRLRAVYRERRDAMLGALARHFPQEARWTRPEGGLFLMVTLPDQVEAARLLEQALQHHVAFVPGEDFFPNGGGQNTMRLNFSNAPPHRIEEGIQRLGALLKNLILNPA